jgi:hypothetical protein
MPGNVPSGGAYGSHRFTVSLDDIPIHCMEVSINVLENGNSFDENWVSAKRYFKSMGA